MRKHPETSPPPVLNTASQLPGTITQTRQYELITPLYGGGVEPTEADSVTVVRAAGIRGQLRFWWRACRGGQFDGTIGTLREAEDLLWGAASTGSRPRPSPVQITVDVAERDRGAEDRPFQVLPGPPGRDGKPKGRVKEVPGSAAPAYAAFPLRPPEDELVPNMATKAVRAGVKFVLTVSFPTNWDEAAFPAQWINAAQTMFANSTPRQEVEAALWAWETFGGVGARTRRGFGALRCISTQENGRNVAVRLPQAGQVQVKTWLAERFREYVVGENWPKNVPHLALKTIKPVVHKEYSSALSIWKYLIGRLRDFRQMRFGGRYGPSQWPEANEIRRRFGSEAPGVSAFPRAAFGLPIIFHFKDQNNGDPRDTTLVWRGADGTLHDRFASPLILRPLGCEGGQAVGLAAILAGTGVRDALDTLVLKDAPDNPTVSGILTPEDAASVPPLRGSDKVLGTFVDML